jgi:hypothetical protein
VEWIEYSALRDDIKKLITDKEVINRQGKVGVIKVDPNYVEQFFVAEQKKMKLAFAWMPDPEKADDPLAVPLISGEESYSEVSRELLTPDSYLETRTTSNGQNIGFSDFLQSQEQEQVQGTPPQATIRQAQWENSADRETGLANARQEFFTYYISSTPNNAYAQAPTDVSYTYAQNLEQALLAAKTDLQMQALSSNGTEKSLAWYYPKIVPGDKVNGELVVNVSINLELDSDATQTIVLAQDGTRVSTGKIPDTSVTYRKVARTGDIPDTKLNQGVDGNKIGELGNISLEVENRRSFKNAAQV